MILSCNLSDSVQESAQRAVESMKERRKTMAKNYVESLMAHNERILLRTRQHWFVLISMIFLEIVLIVLLIAGVSAVTFFYPIAAVGFVLLLVPIAYMLRDILIWFQKQYIVTNRRVVQVSGIFSKDVVDSSLEKVNDVKMSQSFFGRLFDYGDIEILTASEMGVNLFKRIGEPVKFKTAMLNAKEELGYEGTGARSQDTDDIPAQIAELDELRRKGILTEEEFRSKKAELLAKM
jgi:uncharacterized membrane protein YdbT with pleckstrin-like domain